MKKLNLVRKSVQRHPAKLSSYKLDLEVISTEDITKDVFVKQRIKKPDNVIDDTFVAVCTPAQLEDLDANSPQAGSSYFRSSHIQLVGSSLANLHSIFDQIAAELQILCDETEILDEIEADAIYQITSDEITTSMAATHQHYRIPLTAAPAGGQETYIDPTTGVLKHAVINMNNDLPGWLPTGSSDPVGTLFKYNISKDSSLGIVWPIPLEFIAYAHIEINGVTAKDYLVTPAGIFWKTNQFAAVPWPRDYVGVANTGLLANAVTLILDCIK